MPKYIDKFLSFMNINDDDDVADDEYLDDDYDDDYDEEVEDELPKRRIKRSPRNNSSGRSASNDDDFDEEVPRSLSQSEKQAKPRTSAASGSKVSPMRSSSSSRHTLPMEVCVIKPKVFDEVREVTEALLDECTVILNLEGLEMSLIRRITDFSCGSCYALHAKVQQINNFILIIAPSNVDISGDFQEIQDDNFEDVSYGTRY